MLVQQKITHDHNSMIMGQEKDSEAKPSVGGIFVLPVPMCFGERVWEEE